MKITSYACTALAFTFLATSAHAGCNQKTDMEICVTTDGYPHETKCIVDDRGGSQRLEMDGMSKSGKTYCDDVRLCPGWHSLTLKDSYGDGFDDYSGRVTVRPVGSSKIIDERPRNFGYSWTASFRVPDSTTTNNNNNHNNNNNGSGPFGSRNCRECKDECERRNRGDSWGKKRCKTDRCRAHFGKKPCKD